MNAPEFAAISTQLVSKMKTWIEEASKDDVLSPADLAILTQALSVIEQRTYRAVDAKPDTAN
jgi:hypothetical protein